ncbi:MAG: methyltransferase domain-containing protein [Flavobacteriaceae bacterium]
MNFKERIEQEEIMDQGSMELDVLAAAYRDINRSNQFLGGFSASYKVLRRLILSDRKSGTVRVLDMGCGDGGMLRHLARQFRKLEIPIEFLGLDLNTDAIALARQNSIGYPEIRYESANILNYQGETSRHDYVLCTLTLHHFNDNEIPGVIGACQSSCHRAVIINDLQRSKSAYYLFKIFSAIFIRSAVASNDGLVSIRKAFRKNELLEVSKRFPNWEHSIKWNWAYRYVWVIKKKRPTP